MPNIEYTHTDEDEGLEIEFEVSYETLPPEGGAAQWPRFPGGFEDVRFKVARIRGIDPEVSAEYGSWIEAKSIDADIRAELESRMESLYLNAHWDQDRIDTAIAEHEEGRMETAIAERGRP